MNIRSFKNANGLIILLSALAILLLYSVDLLKLSYRLEGWEVFGEMPLHVSEIQYFVADTPLLIGYTDPVSKTSISCATTVAYVRADDGETYRCCDTGDKISCLAGDYSNEIPVIDEVCTDSLKEAFAVPETPEGAAEYRLYGNCPDDGTSHFAVVQVNGDGQILWKFLNVEDVLLWIGTLRCILAPLLLVLIIAIVMITVRAIPKEPIPRF